MKINLKYFEKYTYMSVTSSFRDLLVLIVGATKVVAMILSNSTCPQYFLFEALYDVFMSFFPGTAEEAQNMLKIY